MRRAWAKKIYQKIGIAKSPALCGNIVVFTNIGFNHLIRKKRKFRSQEEQGKRFVLLKYAKAILEGRQATIFYHQKIIGHSTINFWAFTATIDRHDIKVVVSQIDGGQRQFLSIMERKGRR